MTLIYKFLYGLWYGTMLKKELAFQCPNLEKTGCDECKKCGSTGIVKMEGYSWRVIYGMEKYGYKLAWWKWNPTYDEKLDKG